MEEKYGITTSKWKKLSGNLINYFKGDQKIAFLCENPRFLKDYHRFAVKCLSDLTFCRTQNKFGRP